MAQKRAVFSIIIIIIIIIIATSVEPWQLSRYSDRLQSGRPRGRSSSPGRVKNCHFSISSGSTQPPVHWVPGDLSPGLKLPGRQADHSPPSISEVMKTWMYTSIKYMDSFAYFTTTATTTATASVV
jgi:hypothetical protein